MSFFRSDSSVRVSFIIGRHDAIRKNVGKMGEFFFRKVSIYLINEPVNNHRTTNKQEKYTKFPVSSIKHACNVSW